MIQLAFISDSRRGSIFTCVFNLQSIEVLILTGQLEQRDEKIVYNLLALLSILI